MRIVHVLAVWTLLLLAAEVASGQSPELTAAWERTATLYSEGRYAEAEVVAREALERAEKDSGREHPDVATSLTNLAWLYRTLAFATHALVAGEIHGLAEPALG
jgi:hypothetical protein